MRLKKAAQAAVFGSALILSSLSRYHAAFAEQNPRTKLLLDAAGPSEKEKQQPKATKTPKAPKPKVSNSAPKAKDKNKPAKAQKVIKTDAKTVEKALAAHDQTAIVALAKNKTEVEKLLSNEKFREKLSQDILRVASGAMKNEPDLAAIISDMENLQDKLAVVREFLFRRATKGNQTYAREVAPLDNKKTEQWSAPLDADTLIAAAAYLRRSSIRDEKQLNEVLPLSAITSEEEKTKQEAAAPPHQVKLERTETPFPDFGEYQSQVAARLAEARKAEAKKNEEAKKKEEEENLKKKKK